MGESFTILPLILNQPQIKIKMKKIKLLGCLFALIICLTGCGGGGKFEQFAYFKQDETKYRIFVYITDATPEQMQQHAQKQMWSENGTTMVCYFNSSDGLNSDAITLASNVDAVLDEVWKPTMVARYMHWPTGLEEFTEHPYSE